MLEQADEVQTSPLNACVELRVDSTVAVGCCCMCQSLFTHMARAISEIEMKEQSKLMIIDEYYP